MEVQLKTREADRKKVKSFLKFPVFETVKLPFGLACINCNRDLGEAEVNHKHSESEISNCYVKKSKFLCTNNTKELFSISMLFIKNSKHSYYFGTGV